MAEWINSDGLRVRLGNTEAEVTRGGELPSAGEYRKFEFQITLTTAGTASALIPDTTGIIIPSGFRIESVTTIAETAATSGGSAVLNVGLVRQDTTTTYDADGFLAAVALTSHDAAGETVIYRVGTTGAGAFIGTTLANSGYLVFDYDTAAYTAGELRVIIEGYVLRPAASN
jgi:hypothetical protein